MKPKVFLNYANTQGGDFGKFTTQQYLNFLQQERVQCEDAFLAHPHVDALAEAVADMQLNVIPWLQKRENTQNLVFFSFSGHASGGELIFENQAAQCAGLAGFIGKRYCPHLKLVLLNGCLTNSCLDVFKQEEIPIIISTNTPVDDLRAMKFGTAFIKELTQNRTVDEAFDRALSLLKITTTAESYKECYGSRMGRRQHITSNRLSEWQISYREEHFKNWKLSLGIDDPHDPNASSKLFDLKAPNPDHSIYSVDRYEQRASISDFWDDNCTDQQLIHIFLEGRLEHRPFGFARRWFNELRAQGTDLVFDMVEIKEHRKKLRVFKQPDIQPIRQLLLQLTQGKGSEVMVVLPFQINLTACNQREIAAWIKLISGHWLAELTDFPHRIIMAYHCLPKPEAPAGNSFFEKLFGSKEKVTTAGDLWQLAQKHPSRQQNCVCHLENDWHHIGEHHLEEWVSEYASLPTFFMKEMQHLLPTPFPHPMSAVQDQLTVLIEKEYRY